MHFKELRFNYEVTFTMWPQSTLHYDHSQSQNGQTN